MRTDSFTVLLSLGLTLGVGGCSDSGDADVSGETSTGASAESESESEAGTTESETETEDEANEPVNLDVASYPFENLSDYHFFVGDLAELEPNDGVIPYTVAAPLWSDAAEKGRFFVIPEGTTIGFTERDEWEFPVGSVFIKNFYFDLDRGPQEELRIIETRLLVLESDGNWQSYGYLWDEEQTDAEQTKAGADVTIEFIDASGAPQSQLYLVPDQNVCESCHQRDDQKLILGPTTHQMNTVWAIGGDEEVNQIDWLAEQGYLAGDVPPSSELPALAYPAGDAPLDDRARAYLHGNCAHCHRAGGAGGSSGLKFTVWEDDPAEFGVCKLPAAAGPGAGGRSYDIWPGEPDLSIIPFRMASEDPEVKMPELPNLIPDSFGVELVEEWIREMPGEPCE